MMEQVEPSLRVEWVLWEAESPEILRLAKWSMLTIVLGLNACMARYCRCLG
jgi:hypothetical protein